MWCLRILFWLHSELWRFAEPNSLWHAVLRSRYGYYLASEEGFKEEKKGKKKIWLLLVAKIQTLLIRNHVVLLQELTAWHSFAHTFLCANIASIYIKNRENISCLN